MKKVVLSFAVIAMLAVSCGPSVCDCVSLHEKSMEAEDAEKFEEEHKSEMEACKKMQEERTKEMEALEDDEKKKELMDKWMEEAKACK